MTVSKLLKVFSIIILMIVLFGVLLSQFYAENYIGKRRKDCCLLVNKKRVSIKPISIYYLEIVLFGREFILDQHASLYLWRESKCPIKCEKYGVDIGGYEQYLVYSFFTEEEMINLVKKYNGSLKYLKKGNHR